MNKITERLMVMYFCDLLKDAGKVCDYDEADIYEIKTSLEENGVDNKDGIQKEVNKYFSEILNMDIFN